MYVHPRTLVITIKTKANSTFPLCLCDSVVKPILPYIIILCKVKKISLIHPVI